MSRKERIYYNLGRLADEGIIHRDIVVQGNMPGLRWTIQAAGVGTRSLNTSEVEEFINGALAAKYRYEEGWSPE